MYSVPTPEWQHMEAIFYMKTCRKLMLDRVFCITDEIAAVFIK